MKKSYMSTIIGSSGRDRVFIILIWLYGSKAGLYGSKAGLYGSKAGMTPNLCVGRRTHPT